jgi:diaminohydroxyphosphoribosylaminopyrimidine deaminase/5-amino-6-(5-phosphoribosylamino)uracil reductase
VVNDRGFMQRALFHAQRAQGMTTPNPMVGAVVVTPEGTVVGQGRHQRAGDPHAEVFALNDAGPLARGATLYVTLEPCRHHGRTGPCTTRIIAAGISRVVAAMVDPNPIMSGRSLDDLRAAGISVEVGLMAGEAGRLNRAFTTVQTLNRPMVVLKAATSVDGKISAARGARTALTSIQANRRTHQLRAACDAVAVGSSSILVDDPLLTVRECFRARPLARVIFDRRLRTPATARVFSTLVQGPVIIVTSDLSDAGVAERARGLETSGATLVRGTRQLASDLEKLVELNISSLLIEGGAELHRAAWEAGVVDRVHLVVAPVVIGERGVSLFGGVRVPWADLTAVHVDTLGPDTWMEADVHRHR